MRIAARISLFALIGAAATVLVAWGLKVYAASNTGSDHWSVQSFHNDSAALQPWPVPVPPPWTLGRPQMFSRCLGIEFEEWDAYEYRGPGLSVQVLRAGFPMRALGAHHTRDVDREGRMVARHYGVLGRHDGRGIGSLTSLWSGLPSNPLWPGFLLDTAFWGGAAFVVWGVPGFMRRGVRRRRGRCVRCGYELAGVSVCPECGGAA